MSEWASAVIDSNESSSPSPRCNSVGSDDISDDATNEAEGIWSADIEQSFQEALAIYPPCGRRKIILSDEGKMYGRNELIARYIKLRTGKTRSRKQVSSHIQVLARRRTKEITNIKDPSTKEKIRQSLMSLSSSQIVSPLSQKTYSKDLGVVMSPYSMPQNPLAGTGYPNGVQPYWSSPTANHQTKQPFGSALYCGDLDKPMVDVIQQTSWQDSSIAGPNLRLVQLTAYAEQQHDLDSCFRHIIAHIDNSCGYADQPLETIDIRQISDKFPDRTGGLRDLFETGPQSAFYLVKFWADVGASFLSEPATFYGTSTEFESNASMTIQNLTKVCSFGNQVVEKVETMQSAYECGRYVYRIHRSAMCDYMVSFIHRLRQLPERYMMNSVLENFTILQVVTSCETNETLLCIAYVFEVSTGEHGAQRQIYRLVKE